MASSGTITTNYYDSGNNDLGRYRLEWRVSKTDGLVSTISYTVYIDLTGSRLRPYSCFISLAGYNGGTVSISSITVLPEGSYPGDDWSIYPSSGSSVGSGSFTVTHNSSAKGGFTLRLYGGIWVHNNTATDSGSVSNSLPDLYSNCTAPTSVSFSGNPEYLAPNSTDYVEVTWSGATAGTNNPISEYRVYYRYSSNGASPVVGSDSYKGVSNATSARIPLSDSNRGQYLVVGVQSVGKYNSTSLKIASAKKVNVRPNSPTTNGSVTIRSTASEGTITGITAGQSNFGSPGRTVHYNTTDTIPDGQGTAVGSSFTGEPGDYYFWTWDGLEWSSSYTKVSIVKNIVPIINVAVNNLSNSVVQYENSEISNVLETINFTVTAQNKGCYYTLKILRGTGANEKTLYTLKSDSYLSNAGSSESLSFNIRSLGLSEGGFYFRFACNDYLESGENVLIDNNYYSPSLPSFKEDTTYNKFSTQNIPETNAKDFYKELRFTTSFYDSYLYDNGTFRLDNGNNENIQYTISKSIGLNSRDEEVKIYYDVTFSTELTPGQTYDFIPTLQLAGLANPSIISRRQCPILDPTPSTGSSLYIKPFTTGWDKKEGKDTTETQNLVIKNNTSKLWNDNINNFYNEFNIDSNAKWWKSEIVIDGKIIDISTKISGLSFSNDYIERTFSITGSYFYDLIIAAGVNKQGVKNCILRNTVTNRFGETVSRQASIVTLDFNEDSTVEAEIKSPYPYLYETGFINFQWKVTTFLTNDISFCLMVNQNDGQGFVPYYNKQTWPYIDTGSEQIKFGVGRVVGIYDGLTTASRLKEFTSSESWQFSLEFFDGEQKIPFDKIFRFNQLKMTSPSLSFSQANYSSIPSSNKKGKVDCSYNISDWGYDKNQLGEDSNNYQISTSAKLTFKTRDSDIDLINIISNNNDSGIEEFEIDEITDFKTGYLILTTKLFYRKSNKTNYSLVSSGTAPAEGRTYYQKIDDDNFIELDTTNIEKFEEDVYRDLNEIVTLTKTSTSNDLIIYGISPTVAYRQNYLGINTNSIEKNEILRIAPATGRNIITFLKADGSNNIMTVDLKDGTLTGFNIDWNSLTGLPSVIDCGEIGPET